MGRAALDGMDNEPGEQLKDTGFVIFLLIHLLGHIKAKMYRLSWGYWPVQSTQWWWSKVIANAVLLSKVVLTDFADVPIVTAFQTYSS